MPTASLFGREVSDRVQEVEASILPALVELRTADSPAVKKSTPLSYFGPDENQVSNQSVGIVGEPARVAGCFAGS